ncbi:AAA ATPase domain protein [compost metagenome]
MIVATLIRNYKTYQGINYIPLSGGKLFSALVGENGSGKSSILEALDSFFNAREWSIHHSLTKGFPTREPFICPIFLLKKSEFSTLAEQWFLEKISDITWRAKQSEFNPSIKAHAELFCNHREKITEEGYTPSDYYLIPFGVQKEHRSAAPKPFFSIFENHVEFLAATKYASSERAIGELHERLLSHYNYIYLPSDIDFKEYTKIEGRTVQALLGQKIDTIVRGLIKRNDIQEINRNLNEFLEGISETLEEYIYKKPAQKQNLVNQSHLTSKIIEAYFESKVLNKKVGKDTVPVGDLSSGEKRQALIDLAKAFLTSAKPSETQLTILAVDEPELSLHVSTCFSQFEKLRSIAESGVQVLITTHWYGFMPVISQGSAVYCVKSEVEPTLIDLRCFREEIKKLKATTDGQLPVEVELKGINDLVQSIVASVTGARYSWLICEGSADKIYLDHYLKESKILVVPVGGSPTVKKIFNYLQLALGESSGSIQGKAFLLLDTDKQFESFDAKDSLKQIIIRRLQNCETALETQLLKTSDTSYFPPTVIEDTLDPETYIAALRSFEEDEKFGRYIKSLETDFSLSSTEWPAALALNLRPSDRRIIDDLFEQPGFKVKFALRYVDLAQNGKEPAWIAGVRSFLSPAISDPKRRSRPSKPKSS